MGPVEDNLEKCVNTKVDIEGLGRLMEPENAEVSLRFILKYATRGGRKDHCVEIRKRMVGEPGKEGSTARKLAK